MYRRPDLSDPQLALFGQPVPRFDGATLDDTDHVELGGQLRAVADLLADGRARTPREIAEVTKLVRRATGRAVSVIREAV